MVTGFKININYFLYPTLANALPSKTPLSNSNSQQVQNSTTTNRLVSLFKPPNNKKPKYTVGGATRGDSCAIDSENKTEMTALIPASEQRLTLKARPSFFAYLV